MNDALRNSFVIEVGDLFAQDEVFPQCRTTHARLQRVLIVGNRRTLIGRQRPSGWIRAVLVQRMNGHVLANWWRTGLDMPPSCVFRKRNQ